MKKWTYENEIKESTTTLLNAYLDTMHSTTITAIFTYNDDMYVYDLTRDDLNELTTVTVDKLQINNLGKKRIEKILNKSTKFATVNEFENLKTIFPNYKKNNGYLAEFLYRINVNGENVEQIRKSNNSKGYDKASDTKDNKQLKNLDTKATYTSFEYLLTVCERTNYTKLNDVKKAIETLKTIYTK